MRRIVVLTYSGFQILVGSVGLVVAPFIGAEKGFGRGAFDAAIALGVLLIGIGEWRNNA